MDVLWLRGLRDNAFESRGTDQFALTSIPFCQNFGRGCAAKYARMDQTWEANMGDVAGGAEDALEVPDGFGPNTIQIISAFV